MTEESTKEIRDSIESEIERLSVLRKVFDIEAHKKREPLIQSFRSKTVLVIKLTQKTLL